MARQIKTRATQPLVQNLSSYTMSEEPTSLLSQGVNDTENMKRNNAFSTFGNIIKKDVTADENMSKFTDKITQALQSNTSAQNKSDTKENDSNTISDEREKRYRELFGDDLLDLIAKIGAYKFTYKEDAQEKYGADDKEHVGVMAQDLMENPLTEGSVEPLEDGTLTVNTKELTMNEQAEISILAQRVRALELAVYGEK